MSSPIGNSFDAEFNRVSRETGQVSTADEAKYAQERLDMLCAELRRSDTAHEGVLDCRTEGESLLIVVHGQAIGQWTQEGCDLTLYRAGSDMAECQATSVNEAVKLTARLVAAMAQA